MSQPIAIDEPSHRLHLQQWASASPAMSLLISRNEPPHRPQWASSSPAVSFHIARNESPNLQQWASTSPAMSLLISSNEPPHRPQWVSSSPAMSLHIAHNEPPHLQKWASTSPAISINLEMSHHVSSNKPLHHQKSEIIFEKTKIRALGKLCQIFIGTQFQNLASNCCFLTWRRQFCLLPKNGHNTLLELLWFFKLFFLWPGQKQFCPFWGA